MSVRSSLIWERRHMMRCQRMFYGRSWRRKEFELLIFEQSKICMTWLQLVWDHKVGNKGFSYKCKIVLRVNFELLSFYLGLGCNYRTYSISSATMRNFRKWYSSSWRIETRTKQEANFVEASFESIWFSYK